MITPENLHVFNMNLRHEDPDSIIFFALRIAKKPIITTSFGPYSAAILYAASRKRKDIPVVWCDTGYNTESTYNHAQQLIEMLQLQIDIYIPQYTTAYLRATYGVPSIDNPNHTAFSEEVKLAPFLRAMEKHEPDVWFTNVRKDQTAYRDTLDILSFTEEGVLKVSPFYHFNDAQLEAYLKKHELPIEFDYFDPVKALENRECGIQLLS